MISTKRIFIFGAAIGVIFSPTPTHGQNAGCTNQACQSGCLVFDRSWQECNWDWRNKGYDSRTSCLCLWNGQDATITALAQCVACGKEGLAGHELTLYQTWLPLCNGYKVDGAAAAIAAADQTPTATILDVYSSVYLPRVKSEFCRDSTPITTTTIPHNAAATIVGHLAELLVARALLNIIV